MYKFYKYMKEIYTNPLCEASVILPLTWEEEEMFI